MTVTTISAKRKDAVSRTARALRAGGIVAIPTDTVYGLAASLSRPDALHRLYKMKGRPAEKAIPILVSDSVAVIGESELPPPAARLAARYWPGGLTLVVPCRAALPGPVTMVDPDGSRTVALRMPDHDFTRALIRAVGGALAVTSANLSGREPALSAEALGQLPFKEGDLIVDGGRTRGDVASTIVRIEDDTLELLREGAISTAELSAFLRGSHPDISESARYDDQHER